MKRTWTGLLLAVFLSGAACVPGQESLHGFSVTLPDSWHAPNAMDIDWITALLVASLPEEHQNSGAERELSLLLHNPETEIFLIGDDDAGCSFVRTAAYNFPLPPNKLLLLGMLQEVRLLASMQMREILGFCCDTVHSEVLTLQDRNVILLEYLGPFAGYRMTQCLMAQNGRCFVFSLNCRTPEYPERKAEFLGYLETIRFPDECL